MASNLPERPPNQISAWAAAARPRTLPAGAAPVLLGSALAWDDGVFRAAPALAALLGALLIQVGTNLANDYYDHRRGADTATRVGPKRAASSGWILPTHVRNAAILCFAATCLLGLYLIYASAWPILWVGLASIASGYAYTGGPYPLAYHGWGDLFVFVFFGPVAVAGTYYVQALAVPIQVLFASLPLGLLATAILVVNNLRDRETDARAGKRTLAVRWGDSATRREYQFLLLGAYALVALATARHPEAPFLLLPALTLPWGVRLVRRVAQTQDAGQLTATLASTAQLLAAFAVLFSIGVVL